MRGLSFRNNGLIFIINLFFQDQLNCISEIKLMTGNDVAGKGLVFLASPGTRNKREHIFNKLVSLCPENDFSSILYICPNSFVIREVETGFHSFLKRPAYIPFQTMTLRHLGEKIYAENFNKRPITEKMRPLILCNILGDNNTGHARLLSDLFKKLRHYIPGEDLTLIKDKIISQIFEDKAAKRAADAIDTLISYENELKERGLVDPEDIQKDSITYIKEQKHNRPLPQGGMEGFETLIVDGFFDPTPLELEMIMSLIEKAGNVLLLLEKESGILKSLKSVKKEFSIKKLHCKTPRKSTGYYPYNSIEEEVDSIAKTAKGLIMDGTDPREIVVTFPNLKKYFPILKRVFNKHGIPLGIEEYDLSSARPLTALEGILTCMEEDYPAYDFLSLLTSPYFPGIPPIVKEWAVTCSYRAGIIKGKGSWLSIKKTLLSSSAKEDELKLDSFQKGVDEVIAIIEGLKKKKTICSFLDTLEDALNKLGYFDSLRKLPDTGYGNSITETIKAQFSQLRIFNELYNTRLPLSAGEAGKFGSPGPRGDAVEETVFYLRHFLNDLKGFTKRRNGVRAIPFELAAGVESEALFFGGAIEDDLPSRPMIDPVLPEKVKKSIGLPFLEYYISRQKRYFTRILNVSRREPYCSCPSADGDNLLLPSPFLEWDSAKTSASPDIFTHEDLLTMDGSYRNIHTATGMLWDGNTIRGRDTWRELYKKTASITKGYMSVTNIDSYRRCPQRFFIEKVLDINPEEPPRFEVEARLWGSLVHKVMEHLFMDGDIEAEGIDERLFEGLRHAVRKYPLCEIFLHLPLPRIRQGGIS